MVPACSSGPLTNVLPHWNAMPQTWDITPRHSIQTQGGPVVALSIDVECLTGIHNYTFQSLGSDRIRKSFTNLPHKPTNAQLYDAGMVVASQKLSRNCTLPMES